MSKDQFDIEAAKIMFNCAKCDSDQEFRYTALLCLEALEEARKTIVIKDEELKCNYDNISRLLKTHYSLINRIKYYEDCKSI